MNKVLVYLDDFHERTYVEMILKKTGWDVMIISSDLGLANTILSFRPSVFIVSQNVKGKNVREISPKVKKHKGIPKILVIGKKKVEAEEMKKIGVNSYIESPLEPKIFFSILEKFGGPSAKEAFKKLKRSNIVNPEDYEDINYGRVENEGLEPTLAKAFEDEKRKKKYSEILKSVKSPPIKTNYKSVEIDAYVEEIKKTRTKDHDELDKKKKEFIKALFKSKK